MLSLPDNAMNKFIGAMKCWRGLCQAIDRAFFILGLSYKKMKRGFL